MGNHPSKTKSYKNNHQTVHHPPKKSFEPQPRHPTQPQENTFHVDSCIKRLIQVGSSNKHIGKSVCLSPNEISTICRTSYDLFMNQPTLLYLNPGVKVVGDIHGQFHDLIRLFKMCGYPPSTNYLFLGDYVDRGMYSLETILLLLCFKIKYPKNFFLLRGNHESADVTQIYGFYDECKRRTDVRVWKIFCDVFNAMPIAAIVGGKIFCVHGGLSPWMKSMDQIRQLPRPTEVPDQGLLNDLLWSDPSDLSSDWSENDRGVSVCFGSKNIDEFLSRFNLDLICRAHMVVEGGYEFFNNRSLVTVFSAPNYCGEFDNYGAVMTISKDLLCSFEMLPPIQAVTPQQQENK
ncbi:hypothetical protein G6F16_010252 [Rhizopus arrhizus]|nr:hypothetical protein G6F23_007838 [Rhizopus arrhizus]KAG0756455.1 hypothetical protein G6F24_011137 [Rhizopus arrhizus]KAG0787818.1 hypothetical protein G6F22_007195 [Rhizopus arrhizus]KAG0791033.1 hypothetical protein G6F21_005374 [Rhizopus arrhizus]KAG0816991.1 hypothetical protein G6F20_002756 [Rhizopus arrhizus]